MITKKELVDFLNNNEFELKSTKSDLCLPIINRLVKKLNIGISFPSIQVYDNLIINGHHGYVASQISKIEIDRIKWAKSPKHSKVNWSSVKICKFPQK